MILDFIFSLILYRFLLKFRLFLHCKLGAGVLPTAIVFCSATATVLALDTPCTSASIIFLSSFVSNFRLCSKLPSHLRFCPQREKVWVSISLRHRLSSWPSSQLSVLPSALSQPSVRFSASSPPCFWRQIPSRCQTLNLSNLPPDLRCSSSLLLGLLLSCLHCCWLCSCLACIGSALSVLLIFHCCWLCSSRGSCTRVASFLLLTTGSLAVVPSLIPLTTGSLAVVPSLVLQRYFVVVYDSVARFWPPPPLLSIAPLRDRWFAVGALVPRKRSLQQCVLLTMRTGFSFSRNFSYTCSAEMSVPLFSGCVHRRKGFHRGLRLGTTVVFSDIVFFLSRLFASFAASAKGVRFSMTDAICCVRSSCSAVSLAWLCGRPRISEFCRDFVSGLL